MELALAWQQQPAVVQSHHLSLQAVGQTQHDLVKKLQAQEAHVVHTLSSSKGGLSLIVVSLIAFSPAFFLRQ